MTSEYTNSIYKQFFLIILCMGLTSCGFHLQGRLNFAPPFKKLYLQSIDPYGNLTREIKQYLKMSNVELVTKVADAQVILNIQQDATSQTLQSVSGTQQTRQYNIEVAVSFEVTSKTGVILIPSQTLKESRIITVQANQILGSSNESALFYQQMRHSLAYAIMNRLASQEISRKITAAYSK